ncbi:MAG: hypothetical protein LBL84_04045, partial [Candidatus Nomurabacteria bacterium]|nr:hypothetical protein [Candidatus Nomurabacteria bacterium]
ATNVGTTQAGANGFWLRLHRGTQAITPSLVITLVLLGIVTCVALLTHAYRNQLPKALRQSWLRHHALYKIAIVAVMAISAILSYGEGMI